jgi:DNA repair protein RadC
MDRYKKRQSPLRERFAHSGVSDLTDQEVIELLLSQALSPRKSKKMAKECLAKFHTLPRFIKASNQQLQKIGIPDDVRFSIRLIQELPIQVFKKRIIDQPVYKSSREFYAFLRQSMQDLDEEVFKIVFLDEHYHIDDIVELFRGTKNQILISAREIIENALSYGAGYFVLVHNHTSDNSEPSKTDMIFTRDIVFMGVLLQISILDHIIIGRNSYFSFADKGLLQKYKDSFLNMKLKGILGANRLCQSVI